MIKSKLSKINSTNQTPEMGIFFKTVFFFEFHACSQIFSQILHENLFPRSSGYSTIFIDDLIIGIVVCHDGPRHLKMISVRHFQQIPEFANKNQYQKYPGTKFAKSRAQKTKSLRVAEVGTILGKG